MDHRTALDLQSSLHISCSCHAPYLIQTLQHSDHGHQWNYVHCNFPPDQNHCLTPAQPLFQNWMWHLLQLYSGCLSFSCSSSSLHPLFSFTARNTRFSHSSTEFTIYTEKKELRQCLQIFLLIDRSRIYNAKQEYHVLVKKNFCQIYSLIQ